ncbi:putative DNA topoisomerase [Emiliania huxleyi virus 145]|nr:putative DNA topoisomerase [Emiliania huxleyi virus 145]
MGLYPLRGKLMNAGNSSLKALAANKEISELIQILGITPYKKYDLASARALPYRHLVIFTDQDVDGSHISGLCIQLIMTLVPSLLEVFPDYIKRFATPILKITSGKHAGKTFYTDAEYREYTDKHPDSKNASVKYYKGLGTSTDKDAKQYFTEWSKNVITINNTGQPSTEAMKLAFDAKMSAERREYLANQYNPNANINYSAQSTTIERFIYDDLMHFSNYDNIRSIPKMLDGQKAGQRKVVFYALNHVGKNEAKVAQMAGTAAQVTQYHHGEVSLANTIIGMAATYTGSHNLPLLYPSGQFGSRHAKNSAAAPRYIFTHISSFLPRLIKSEDNDVLTYNVDENKKVEPTVYIPVIPIVLVNGANGIGTGWKCDVPQYNPLEVIDACKRMANGGELSTSKWVPWYVGYNGKMEETTDGFNSIGTYEVSGNTLTVTELPIGRATEDWIESIQSLIPDKIKNYEKNLGPDSVTIKLNLTSPIDDPVATLKLSTKLQTNRMWLYNAKNKITHYAGPTQIIQEHARERLKLYEASRISQIEKASHKMDLLNNKIRYIMEFIEGKIKIGKMSTSSLNEYLAQNGYLRSNNSFRYLTDDISTGQLTTDNVDKLRNQIRNITTDIDALRETTANKMWITDLNALRKEVDEYIVERLTPLDEDAPKPKKARK